MIVMLPGETTICDYPCSFFLALFILTIALGFWLGHRLALWRIRRLQQRVELQRLEIQMLAPRRGLGL